MQMIQQLKTSQLTPHASNPRTIAHDDLERLCVSIKENADYFNARPIIASDRTGALVVIAGNQRLAAAKKLKLKTVPVYVMHDLTEEKEREIMIRDNVSNGAWDFEALEDWDEDELNDYGLFLPDVDDADAESPSIAPPPPEWSLHVINTSERELEKLFNELTQRGYECKIIH